MCAKRVGRVTPERHLGFPEYVPGMILARALGISKVTLRVWRKKGLPSTKLPGKRRLYSVGRVAEWCAAAGKGDVNEIRSLLLEGASEVRPLIEGPLFILLLEVGDRLGLSFETLVQMIAGGCIIRGENALVVLKPLFDSVESPEGMAKLLAFAGERDAEELRNTVEKTVRRYGGPVRKTETAKKVTNRKRIRKTTKPVRVKRGTED